MPRKNANGEGTIYNNGKFWIGQVTIGRDPETGKPKRKSVYGKTRRIVKDKMTAIMFELSTQSFVDPSNMRVADWVNYWLENFKRPNISAATYNKVDGIAQNHIIKPLGDKSLKDLNVFQVQTALNELQKAGLSDSYINRVYTYINAMLKKAVDIELIRKNPCVNVVIPKSGRKREIIALTKDEQAALIKVCQKHANGDLFIFLVGTGMRIGETLTLKWVDIDFEDGSIFVTKTIVEIRGKASIKDTTKTPSGMRKIYMSEKIKELLKEIKNKQDSSRNLHNLVFPSRDYTLNLSANIRIRLGKYCKEAGIKYINIHALRHTFATRALEQGMNVKVLSKVLGHKDIKVTLNTYSHVLQDFEKESMMGIDIFS